MDSNASSNEKNNESTDDSKMRVITMTKRRERKMILLDTILNQQRSRRKIIIYMYIFHLVPSYMVFSAFAKTQMIHCLFSLLICILRFIQNITDMWVNYPPNEYIHYPLDGWIISKW